MSCSFAIDYHSYGVCVSVEVFICMYTYFGNQVRTICLKFMCLLAGQVSPKARFPCVLGYDDPYHNEAAAQRGRPPGVQHVRRRPRRCQLCLCRRTVRTDQGTQRGLEGGLGLVEGLGLGLREGGGGGGRGEE